MKNSIVKFIGLLLPAFMALAPQLGIPISDDVMAGAAMFGPAITGVLTNGFGGTTQAVFTTVTGLLPFIGWLVLLLLHITIAPGVFVVIAFILTIIIAKHDNMSDLPDWMNQWMQNKLAIPKG